jgi:hypothetical protein
LMYHYHFYLHSHQQSMIQICYCLMHSFWKGTKEEILALVILKIVSIRLSVQISSLNEIYSAVDQNCYCRSSLGGYEHFKHKNGWFFFEMKSIKFDCPWFPLALIKFFFVMSFHLAIDVGNNTKIVYYYCANNGHPF